MSLIIGSRDTDLGILEHDSEEVIEGFQHLESLPDEELERIANEIMTEQN